MEKKIRRTTAKEFVAIIERTYFVKSQQSVGAKPIIKIRENDVVVLAETAFSTFFNELIQLAICLEIGWICDVKEVFRKGYHVRFVFSCQEEETTQDNEYLTLTLKNDTNV